MATMTNSRRRPSLDPSRFTGVFREAPWRAETRQMALWGLVGVVVFAFAGMYVFLSAQTDIAFREEQQLLQAREELFFEVKRLEADLANEYAFDSMAQRAYALGYTPQTNASIEYIVVPPVIEQDEPIGLATPTETVAPVKETLLDWVARIAGQFLAVEAN